MIFSVFSVFSIDHRVRPCPTHDQSGSTKSARRLTTSTTPSPRSRTSTSSPQEQVQDQLSEEHWRLVIGAVTSKCHHTDATSSSTNLWNLLTWTFPLQPKSLKKNLLRPLVRTFEHFILINSFVINLSERKFCSNFNLFGFRSGNLVMILMKWTHPLSTS